MHVPPALWELAFTLDAKASAFRRRCLDTLGLGRPSRLLPYRGFGTADRVRVLARVLEDWGQVSASLERGVVRGVVASLRRFATAELPHVAVDVRWGDARWSTESDEEGFIALDVPPPAAAPIGWHTLDLSVAGDRGTGRSADVLVVGNEAELAIVSDVDDTIIDTGVTSRWRRAEAMFLSDIRARRPFGGTAELYQALHQGCRNGATNPIVYVSSSPWNLYDHLVHFLATHELPKGPILLRDWGLHREGFAPDGSHLHKVEKIETALSLLPTIPVLLIGDSSQEDPLHYREIVRRYPDRIVGVLIRRVWSKAARLERLERVRDELRGSGADLCVFERSHDALSYCRTRGWVR